MLETQKDLAGLASLLTTLGYVLVILGAWLLYRNAPMDLGGRETLKVPIFRGSLSEAGEREGEGIRSRASWSRYGFMPLLVGSFLQLLGYWIPQD